jgi:pimeloyl-ACP methyl ester carboxylesterase
MTPFESRTFALRDPAEPGRIIRGRVDVPSPALAASGRAPYAILLHGFKGFMDWGFFPDMARRLASHGIVSVRFNASGSGVGEDLENFTELDAFERNTLTREIEDLESVRRWIDDGGVREIDAERAVVLGHSRGGGLALVHAAESRAYRGVVTWAAVASFDRFDEHAKELWRRNGFLPIQNARTGQEMRLGLAALEDLERHRDRFDVPSACRRLGAPALLVH